MNIRLDVHDVNVVGNRSVMGEQALLQRFRTRQAPVGFPDHFSYTTAPPGAVAYVVAIAAAFDAAAGEAVGGASAHPNGGSMGFRDFPRRSGAKTKPEMKNCVLLEVSF